MARFRTSPEGMARLTRRAGIGLLLAAILAPAAFGVHRYGRKADDQIPGTQPGPSPTLMAPAPPGAAALFSGHAEDVATNWVQRNHTPPSWKVEDGVMTSSESDIVSKQRFDDFQLHVEFKEPDLPNAHGQEKGNSGVYLQGRYEIQVLDSYGIADPGTGDCAAVYSQAAPLVNACRPPLEWQTYDITFRAPRGDDSGKVTEPAHVTVVQNGITVQNNQEIKGPTGGSMDNDVLKPGPIRLQYHNNSVQFRNVWVVSLRPHGATHY